MSQISLPKVETISTLTDTKLPALLYVIYTTSDIGFYRQLDDWGYNQLILLYVHTLQSALTCVNDQTASKVLSSMPFCSVAQYGIICICICAIYIVGACGYTL